MDRLHAELPPDLTAADRGRALMGPFLDAAPPERALDAEVLVSELVTNAVVHTPPDAEGAVRLVVEARGSRLRVEVQDAGPGVPHGVPELPDASQTSGRGLALVRGLSDRWGVEHGPSRVWFEMELGHPDPA